MNFPIAKLRQPTGQTFFPTFLRNFPISFKPMVDIVKFFCENVEKNTVFHFGSGRHASLPQNPVVKNLIGILTEFLLGVKQYFYKNFRIIILSY